MDADFRTPSLQIATHDGNICRRSQDSVAKHWYVEYKRAAEVPTRSTKLSSEDEIAQCRYSQIYGLNNHFVDYGTRCLTVTVAHFSCPAYYRVNGSA
jgi:hypothetical protein